MSIFHYKYPVRLSEEQRRFLEAMVQTSRTPAKHYLVARVLLMSDQQEGQSRHANGLIAEALSISPAGTGQSPDRPFGDPLHPKACELA